MHSDFDELKHRSNDRVLVLERIEGENTVSSTGLIDNRLYKGGNRLHAVLDDRTTLWELKYEQGTLPPALQQRWTSFKSLVSFATRYFGSRGLKLVKIED